jgi:hypothetical protein
MRYLLKSTEREQIGNYITWELVFYNAETGKIETITEYQFMEEKINE